MEFVYFNLSPLPHLFQFNKFFQPALSLLLKLKLSKPIARRLDPVVTYLSRHKAAFRRYIYPKCFQELMGHIWTKIVQVPNSDCSNNSLGNCWTLQDMEEVALKLKKEKKPVTHQAHQLLQTVAVSLYFFVLNKSLPPLISTSSK